MFDDGSEYEKEIRSVVFFWGVFPSLSLSDSVDLKPAEKMDPRGQMF